MGYFDKEAGLDSINYKVIDKSDAKIAKEIKDKFTTKKNGNSIRVPGRK
jgi:hypothetical protein